MVDFENKALGIGKGLTKLWNASSDLQHYLRDRNDEQSYFDAELLESVKYYLEQATACMKQTSMLMKE